MTGTDFAAAYAVNNSAKPQTTSIRAKTPRSLCEVAIEPK